MSLNKKNMMAVAAVALAAGSAFAAPVTASYTSFGTLSAATFGGSGISNDAVAVTSLSGATLGLSATPRYNSPALSNNGAGVFQAQAGAYGSGDNMALWNYDYYIGGGLTALQYSYKLLVDFNPAAGNDQSTYTDMSYLLLAGAQNSQNLGFNTGYLQFDPTQNGEYGVVLAAFKNGREVGRSAILVDVGDVPEPASYALVGAALAGAAFAARRRKV